MSSPLPYCRPNQTSSDVGMIGMITASARDAVVRTGDAMEPSENSSMISRARACACAQGSVRSECCPDMKFRLFGLVDHLPDWCEPDDEYYEQLPNGDYRLHRYNVVGFPG